MFHTLPRSLRCLQTDLPIKTTVGRLCEKCPPSAAVGPLKCVNDSDLAVGTEYENRPAAYWWIAVEVAAAACGSVEISVTSLNERSHGAAPDAATVAAGVAKVENGC